MARQNTIEIILISDAVYTGCCAVRHDKSPTEHCCRVVFMTCWHKFQMIFNGRFIASIVGRLKRLYRGVSGVDMVLLTYREEQKQSRHPIAGLLPPALESWSDIYTGPTSCLIVLQKFSSFDFYQPSLSFCHSARLFTERSLLHIMSRHAPYCWLATTFYFKVFIEL